MRCPFCGFEDTKVINSRSIGDRKRRRRECTNCGRRFTTYEMIESPILLVVKKDNTFEPFDRSKLIQSMSLAVKKRPVSIEDINHIVNDIENSCAAEDPPQISTARIGEMVVESLRKLDPVAYVRFTSVYKDFDNLDSFISLISELRESEEKDRIRAAAAADGNIAPDEDNG